MDKSSKKSLRRDTPRSKKQSSSPASPKRDQSTSKTKSTKAEAEATPLTKNKRPLTNYMLFVKDNLTKIQEELGTKSPVYVSKRAGEMWRELDLKAKDEYSTQAKELKLIYDKGLQMASEKKIVYRQVKLVKEDSKRKKGSKQSDQDESHSD